MTLNDALLQCVDDLYDEASTYPVLATDELLSGDRCYVVVPDIHKELWFNLWVHRCSDLSVMLNQLECAFKYKRLNLLSSLAFTCVGSQHWQILSMRALEQLNQCTWEEIPHVNDAYRF